MVDSPIQKYCNLRLGNNRKIHLPDKSFISDHIVAVIYEPRPRSKETIYRIRFDLKGESQIQEILEELEETRTSLNLTFQIGSKTMAIASMNIFDGSYALVNNVPFYDAFLGKKQL